MKTLNTPWAKFERVKPKSRNLRPADHICESCGRETTGVGGMTYMHGRWLCNDCQDKERRGKL